PRSSWKALAPRGSVPSKGLMHSGEGEVLAVLDHGLGRYSLGDPTEPFDPEAPPFRGGMIGFIGYDLGPRIERVPRRIKRDSRLPDIRMGLYDTAVTVDARSGLVELWAWDLT